MIGTFFIGNFMIVGAMIYGIATGHYDMSVKILIMSLAIKSLGTSSGQTNIFIVSDEKKIDTIKQTITKNKEGG